MDAPIRPRASRHGRVPRGAYEKPALRRFSLRADEVLAKGCKIASGGTSFQSPGCLPGGCFNTGS